MPSFPPKILLTLQNIVTISEKSSLRDEVSAHTATFLKIVSQNAADCISAHIHFKKFPGGHATGPFQEAWAFGHLGVNGKSQIEPWWVAKMTEARDGDSPLACSLCVSRSSLRPYYFNVPSTQATQKSPMVKNQHNTDPVSNEDQHGFKMASKSSFYPQKVYSCTAYFVSLRVWKGLIISEQLIC